ncbi:MAG: S8 family serine peptidase, partial [Nevskiales bacterium]|nr:S8 family serine peptidase [Nevskiales bacterium]
MENPFVKNQFLLRVREQEVVDGLTMANRYLEKKIAEYAYPNFISVFVDQETVLNDTLFANQWHHRNTGASGGTADADADTTMAWDITQGIAGTVIAVLENGGFDMGHPDLTPNFWVNATESTGTAGTDDDGNGFIDDINGWDFVGCTSPTTSGCGDNNPSPASPTTEDHGTAVAGVAAARGNNMLGVSGACPNCRMMLLRTGYA